MNDMKKRGEKKSGQKRVVNPRFAKGEGYRKVLENIVAEGKCPFCKDNFKYHKHPVLREDDKWILTRCSWPYENTKEHFLVISKTHKEQFFDLAQGDMESVRLLVNWAIRKFHLKGGSLALRFGDTEHTGATVCHLHFHLIVPKISKTVNFPIG